MWQVPKIRGPSSRAFIVRKQGFKAAPNDRNSYVASVRVLVALQAGKLDASSSALIVMWMPTPGLQMFVPRV